MKIIAVNISQNIKELTPEESVMCAWKLNLKRARSYDYIVGVSKGVVVENGYFRFEKDRIYKDDNNRLNFILQKCSENEKQKIIEFLTNKNLGYFTTKYL